MAINAEMAISVLLENAGYDAVFLHLPDERFDRPIIQVQNVGGKRDGVLALDRIQISVIAPKRQDSSTIANRVLDMLIDEPHFVPGHGLIDLIQAESIPVEVPFKDPRIKNIFTIAAHSRIS